MQKAASSAVSSAISVLLLKATISSSVCSRSTLCVLPVCHTEYSKLCPQRLSTQSMCNFLMDLLLWTGLPPLTECVGIWSAVTGSTVWSDCLDLWEGGSCVPTMAFVPSVQISKLKKGKKPFSITMKIVLTLWTFWKGFRGPWGSMVHILRTAALGYLAQYLVLHSYLSTWLLKKC